MTPPDSPGWRPTALHARAAVGAVILLAVGVLFHRSDLVVIAAPLALIAVWGRAARPGAEPQPRLTTRGGDVCEGLPLELGIGIAHAADAAGVALVPARHVTADRSEAVGVADGPDLDLRLAVRADRWGRHVVDVVVASHSAWSAYTHEWQPPQPMELVAVPGSAPPAVTAIDSTGRRLGVHLSPAEGSGTDIRDIRELRPGDRPRLVDWRVTARTGRVHVRTMHAEADLPTWLVVDALGELPGVVPDAESSLTRTMRAAAAVIRRAGLAGDPLGMNVVGALDRPVGIGSGRRHGDVLLGTLARIRPGSVRDADRTAHQPLPGGSLVVVVSPLTSGVVAGAAVRHARAGMRVVVLDTCPDDIRAPDEPTRLAWRLVQARHRELVDALGREGVLVVPWTGPVSLDLALSRLRGSR